MQNAEEYLKKLTRHRSNASSDAHDEITKKLDEVLFYLNIVKNSTTVNIGPHEALTRIFTGQMMYVDTRDNAMSPHLMMSGMWEENITKAFRALVKAGDTVMDIGANFGYFGMVAGIDAGQTGRVVFIEANPYLTPYIEKSAVVNGLIRRSDVVNVAISDKKGTATFNLIKNNWVSSGLVDVKELAKTDGINYTLDEKIEVETTTIDALRERLKIKSVDVIKMDIEGYEDKAFAGMAETIKNSPGLKVLLEFTPNRYPQPEKFFSGLSRSFSFLYVIDKNGELQPINDYSELQANLQNDWAMLVVSKDKLN
jgi:FkbM family methyltransferase